MTGPPELTWYEIADALWLAEHTAEGTAEAVTGDDATEVRSDRPAPAPDPGVIGTHRPEPKPPPDPTETTETRPGRAPGAVTALVGDESGSAGAPLTIRLPGSPSEEATGRVIRRGRSALRGARGVVRALRPLKQLVSSPYRLVLDVEETAVRAAELGRWLPQLTPASELRWDVVVVVDAHESMAAWSDTVSEFVDLLGRQGAFRDVSVRRLDTGGTNSDDLVLRGPAGGLSAGTSTVLTTYGRRLLLVLTDGAAPAWHSGAAMPILHRWAQRLPVAVFNLRPQRQWPRSGLRPVRLRLRAPESGVPNARLFWEPRVSSPLDEWDTGDKALLPVPVLELRPGWIAAWVRLITAGGTGWTNLPGVLVGGLEPDDAGAEAADEELRDKETAPARRRVQEFASWATPTALTLATHLAAAPLNLPVMRILQRELLPDSDPSHLSEVLNSGLLYPVAENADRSPDVDRVTYEFETGIREELLAVSRRAQTLRVVRMVGDYLGPKVPAVSGMRRVLDDPDSGPDRVVDDDSAPFVRVEQAVLQSLSGPYLGRSRQLRQTLAPMEPKPARTAKMEQPPNQSGRTAGVSTTHEVEVASAPAATTRVRTGAPAISGNVPPRNPNFTGRAELLDLLDERVRSGAGGTPTAVLPHALHGMGGVGKSLLAVEYVYRKQQDYDVIWWIPADSATQIQNALVELAQRMRLPVGQEANTAVPAVLDALRRGEPYQHWLLIFDNAESPETVRRFFPTSGIGSIIVTSRNVAWTNAARPLLVDVFTRPESLALLQGRGPELADVDADRLAEALGDLPLALEQVAAWRAETGMTADEYLRLFDEKRHELLQVSPPLDYPVPVAAAWNVSLDQLATRSPAALRLLQVCSFFAPEPIPRTLLGQVRSPDLDPELASALSGPMSLSRSIREINRYALARIDYRTTSIQMHRLVQAVLIDRMSDSERESMRNSAHALLAARDPGDPVPPANWGTYSELYPHLMASEAYKSKDPWVQQLVDNEAAYLYWWGDHEAALELSRLAYEARVDRVGREAPVTLKIGRWMGFMLFVTGRFQEAARFNDALLRDHENTTTEDTEELLAAIGAVAADRRVAGDFRGALEMDQDVYVRHQRALGDDDPATLNAGHNLAGSIRLVGDLRGALDRDEKTTERRGRMFGEDHAVTLTTAQNRIIDQRELGDYITAQANQQRIVDRLRQLLSPGHPQTLRAMCNLSVAIRQAGDHEGARSLSEEVRTGFLTRYGEDHPDSLLAGLNLSIDLRQTGQLEGAIEIGAKVHAGYQRLFGEDHPLTLAALLNGACTLRLSGDAEQARLTNESGRERLITRLGPDHPLVLAASVNLANDHFALGDFETALQIDTDTVERLRRTFGHDHPTTLACQGNLAKDLYALGRPDEAGRQLAETVAAFVRTLGGGHPATAVAGDRTVRANCDLNVMPL